MRVGREQRARTYLIKRYIELLAGWALLYSIRLTTVLKAMSNQTHTHKKLYLVIN